MMTDPAIEIRPARLDELPEVVDLCMLVEAQHESYWPLRWARRPGLHEGYLGWLTRRLDEPRMLIAIAKVPNEPAIAGMVIITIEKEIPIYTYAEYAYIQDMAVVDAHRGRGIAGQLLAFAADWARTRHRLTQLRLLVANQNPTARAAFEKAGFRPTYQEMILPLLPDDHLPAPKP